MNYDYSYDLTYYGKQLDSYYQYDFCRVFLCKEYDDKVIKIQDKMFENFIKNERFYALLEAGKQNGFNFPLEMNHKTVFTFLFNYDYFHYIHKCIQDLFKNNDISIDNYNKLINLLKK
tara:strand:- start:2136 stop:2489 length:354 start_codon:yes stop_codon:yes gene_type:complete